MFKQGEWVFPPVSFHAEAEQNPFSTGVCSCSLGIEFWTFPFRSQCESALSLIRSDVGRFFPNFLLHSGSLTPSLAAPSELQLEIRFEISFFPKIFCVLFDNSLLFRTLLFFAYLRSGADVFSFRSFYRATIRACRTYISLENSFRSGLSLGLFVAA